MSERGEVLVTWPGFDLDGPQAGARLRQAGLRVRLAPKTGPRTADEVRLLARGAVAAIVSTDPFDRATLAAAEQLRVVARVGVGTDSIDLPAATEEGVIVTVTPGANRETTADHAVALILAALRRIVEHDASVRRGEWERGSAMTPWDLHGTTVGLIGHGAIGRAVARRLRGFGVRLLVCDPAVREEPDAELVTLAELLERADVISLHLPLSAATRGLIGARELACMRPEATLVNASRGGLVDEAALIDALTTGRLRAAALDVFADEPAVPPRLLELPNVTLTPHIGGLSTTSIARMVEMATASVLATLDGAVDPGLVANPAVLQTPEAIG
ncbi:MAG TPA: phosphoglycerate dehydrogenase [Solirubrobacter sp.]|nr:phosphoglycerate dehydrogenase [Solirubrobacter sp.]